MCLGGRDGVICMDGSGGCKVAGVLQWLAQVYISKKETSRGVVVVLGRVGLRRSCPAIQEGAGMDPPF